MFILEITTSIETFKKLITLSVTFCSTKIQRKLTKNGKRPTLCHTLRDYESIEKLSAALQMTVF